MDSTYTIPVSLKQRLSSEQAYHYRIVPVSSDNGIIKFKTDKFDHQLKNELSILLNTEVDLIEETTETVSQYLSVNYRLGSSVSENLIFTTDFLERILFTAKSMGSSDIHFEPFEHRCRVRYRLDGKLKEQFHIELDQYPIIVNKIKIKAGLDISEKRLPQDGRMTVKINNGEFDIRVSSMPTFHGEKLVLRLLSKDASHIELENLGLSGTEESIYKEILKKPNGIILISGPTGSGKTTTLYATLKLLNDDRTNILTIEDPIEYTLEGINQVQLKENIGLDFSSTLRTFLRQDPDIIMVGEIRDPKTANMAIRAALTGHLVLSTIHTNSAWATISRLIDMNIPPFLIGNTLNISVAQRLVRLLCNNCKVKRPIESDDIKENLVNDNNLKYHFVPVGCNYCHHTGYKGRRAIYEMLPVTKELIERINGDHGDIDDYFIVHNVISLKQNSIELIRKGETSIEEVYPLLAEH